MRILYIILGDLGDVSSGSGIRPNSMYYAFHEQGHDVYTLSGFQGRKEGHLRKIEVEKAIKWCEEEKPDLCYIESSTYPIIHRCDYYMIDYLHRSRIPTGYFYRDFYRRFPRLFPRRRGAVNLLKELFLDIMQYKTDLYLKKLDIIYYPSPQCFKYFSYKDMRTLPPAGENKFLDFPDVKKTCIYVGGVSDTYGYPLMMETFKYLNSEKEECKLILVCREAEYKNVKSYEEYEWLEVYHKSGDELEPLYKRADLGLLTLSENEYSDLAVGTKLFQYLSYGLPVISTDAEAMKTIIKENGFGEVTPYDIEVFSNTIRKMLDEKNLNMYRKNVKEKMLEKHLWKHRVNQIIEDLVKL